MYPIHWARVMWQLNLYKLFQYAVWGFVVDLNQLTKIWGTVNACVHIEFNPSVVEFRSQWSKLKDYHVFLGCHLEFPFGQQSVAIAR